MSTTRDQRLQWASICDKHLLFENITKFEELFPGLFADRESAPVNLAFDRDGRPYHTGINSWCQHRREDGSYENYYVAPRDIVLERIQKSDVVGGTKYFTIVDRGDNVSLVTVQWDQIIGSRWIAFIDTDSIAEVVS